MKKVAILQSNYIPWKGYFDLINSVDEFIIYDSMQYTRRDWRNRNQIKTANGLQWLSIPVETKGNYTSPIRETKVADMRWKAKHIESLRHNYSKALCFKDNFAWLESLLMEIKSLYLSEINLILMKAICEYFGIQTKISWDTDYGLIEGKTQRLVDLCQKVGADEYISGPAAKSYIQEDLFNQANIKLTWFDYSDYKEYTQLYPPFVHNVSVIDLIFNEGENAKMYLKSFNAINGGGGVTKYRYYAFKEGMAS